MNNFTGVDLYRLVKPHLGRISGTGCHTTDIKNIKNFAKYHELLNCLLEELDGVIYDSNDSYERSVLDMREKAIDIMSEVRAWLNDYEEFNDKKEVTY